MSFSSLISVIMPVYNAKSFLVLSIQSILDQTYPNFEFIIINDGSKDRSGEIINNFAAKDQRIRVINNKINLGIVASLNKGLKKAEGKYIARMDADDIAYRNRLKTQLTFLGKHPNIFLCSSDAILINKDDNIVGKTNLSPITETNLLLNNPIMHPTVMFRNNHKYFYRSKFTSGEDYDLWLRMLSDKQNMFLIKKFLIKYRVLLSGASFSKNQMPYFVKKAKDFYWERINSGHDGYDALKSFPPQRGTKADYAYAQKGYLWTMLTNNCRDEAKKYFKHSFYPHKVGIRLWITYLMFIYLPFTLPAVIKLANKISKLKAVTKFN